MKLRRFSVKVDGIERVGTLLSAVAFANLGANKATIIVSDEEVARVKEIMMPIILSGDIPEDKRRLCGWLQNPYRNLEESEVDPILLSEIMNRLKGSIVIVEKDSKKYEFKIYTDESINDSEITETFERSFLYKRLNNGKVIVYDSGAFFGSNNSVSGMYLVFDSFESFQNSVRAINDSFYNGSFQNRLRGITERNLTGITLIDAEFDDEDSLDIWNYLVVAYASFNRNTDIYCKNTLKKVFDHIKPKSISQDINKLLVIIAEDLEWSAVVNGHEINFKYNNATRKTTADKDVCPICGSLVIDTWTLPNGDKVCPNCILRNVRNYENRRMLSYHTRTISNVQNSCGSKPSEKSRYGFELEMICNTPKSNAAFNETWLPKWYESIAPIMYSKGNLAKLERDGSLGSNGEEMISQPLNKEFILGNEIKALLNACKELYHPENCCGLHLHVDSSALTSREWGSLLRFFTNNYNQFVEAGIFRPTNHYNSLDFLKQSIERFEDDLDLFDYFRRNVSHYSSVSLSRSTGGKTIEFRCFASTVEYEQFIKNLKTIMMFLDNVDLLKKCNNVVIQQ